MKEKEFKQRANMLKQELESYVEMRTEKKFNCSLWSDGIYFHMLGDDEKYIPFAEFRAFMQNDELHYSIGTTGEFQANSDRADLYRAFGIMLDDQARWQIAYIIRKRCDLELEAITEELCAKGAIPASVEGGKEVGHE
jgi:hypothetical protein